jgi:hypothetical protein
MVWWGCVRGAWPLLLVAACSDVERDLLAREPSPCSIDGAIGEWVNVSPPELVYGGTVRPLMDLAMDPYDPSVLYAGTQALGLWKTGDCGASWVHIDTGINRVTIDNGQLISVELDRAVPDTIYASTWFSGATVFWSTNGGVHWEELFPIAMMQALGGGSSWKIAVDPVAAHHIIATTVSAWTGTNGDSGIIEGRYVAGAWQWTIHPPVPGLGTQQWIGFVDPSTWLVTSMSSGQGSWITTDGGQTFEHVDPNQTAGDWQWYGSRDGTLYQTGLYGLLRSTDHGATWIDVFEGLDLSGTQAMIGDGEHLYAALAVPNDGVLPRLYTAPEVPGDRDWQPLGGTSTFSFDKFLRDPQRDVMYAFNGYQGVFRMRLR